VKSIFIAATLVVSVAAGQYLEKTIWLPDSFRAVGTPSNVLYNSGSNTIYVGDRSRGGIVVLDGITLRKAAQVFLPGTPELMLYAPEVNKVYCLTRSHSVYVIDGAGHGVLAVVPVGGYAYDLCFNPVTRRIYCASSDSVTAIDASADTVVAAVYVPTGARKMCCNWLGNKVYCADESEGLVYVIDGESNRILTHMYVSENPGQMLYNPLSNRVYCPDESYYDVGIIDAGADTLVRWITMGASHMGLCMNPPDNELYVTDGSLDRLFVICGTGDSLKSRTDIGADPRSPVYDSVANRVYVVCKGIDSLVAIDAAGDTVVNRVRVGHSPAGLCIDTRQRRAFVAHWDSRDVHVLDVPDDTVIADIDFWFGPASLSYCTGADKLYCGSGTDARLAAVDGIDLVATGYLDVPVVVSDMLYTEDYGKVYCGCQSPYEQTLVAIDCAGDSVVAEIEAGVGPHRLAYRPPRDDAGKLYCGNYTGASVAVLDCSADTVVNRFALGGNVAGAVYGDEHDRLFCITAYYPVFYVVDCATDSILSSVQLDDSPTDICCIPEYDYVCVAGGRTGVIVFGGDRGQLVDIIDIGMRAYGMEYCSARDKLYCKGDGDSLAVVDIESLSLEGQIPTLARYSEMLYDSIANRLYCIGDYPWEIDVLDCRADSFVTTLQLEGSPGQAVWSPEWRRLFVAVSGQGGILVIRDSTTVGIGEGVQQTRGARVTQTVVRGVLNLAEDGTRSEFGTNSAMSLVDITGRKVMDLRPGENDVRDLAPGVYFVRTAVSGRRSAVRKVIVNP
jgi:YVTN family beta-propeller protein